MNETTKATMFSSSYEDWETPWDFFRAVSKSYKFDLDAAASIENHKCVNFITKEENSLIKTWVGNVWLNPPFSKTLPVGIWVDKAINEYEKNGTMTTMLVPARTDTRWFIKAVNHADHVIFLKGRLAFIRSGTTPVSAPFPSALITIGNKSNSYLAELLWWDWKDPKAIIAVNNNNRLIGMLDV